MYLLRIIPNVPNTKNMDNEIVGFTTKSPRNKTIRSTVSEKIVNELPITLEVKFSIPVVIE